MHFTEGRRKIVVWSYVWKINGDSWCISAITGLKLENDNNMSLRVKAILQGAYIHTPLGKKIEAGYNHAAVGSTVKISFHRKSRQTNHAYQCLRFKKKKYN